MPPPFNDFSEMTDAHEASNGTPPSSAHNAPNVRPLRSVTINEDANEVRIFSNQDDPPIHHAYQSATFDADVIDESCLDDLLLLAEKIMKLELNDIYPDDEKNLFISALKNLEDCLIFQSHTEIELDEATKALNFEREYKSVWLSKENNILSQHKLHWGEVLKAKEKEISQARDIWHAKYVAYRDVKNAGAVDGVDSAAHKENVIEAEKAWRAADAPCKALENKYLGWIDSFAKNKVSFIENINSKTAFYDGWINYYLQWALNATSPVNAAAERVLAAKEALETAWIVLNSFAQETIMGHYASAIEDLDDCLLAQADAGAELEEAINNLNAARMNKYIWEEEGGYRASQEVVALSVELNEKKKELSLEYSESLAQEYRVACDRFYAVRDLIINRNEILDSSIADCLQMKLNAERAVNAAAENVESARMMLTCLAQEVATFADDVQTTTTSAHDNRFSMRDDSIVYGTVDQDSTMDDWGVPNSFCSFAMPAARMNSAEEDFRLDIDAQYAVQEAFSALNLDNSSSDCEIAAVIGAVQSEKFANDVHHYSM
jgi:hypothetical protein